MTAFYWVDTAQEAAIDAATKGFQASKWMWADTVTMLKGVTVTAFDGIYLKAGIIELEQEFARIQRRYSPLWPC